MLARLSVKRVMVLWVVRALEKKKKKRKEKRKKKNRDATKAWIKEWEV